MRNLFLIVAVFVFLCGCSNDDNNQKAESNKKVAGSQSNVTGLMPELFKADSMYVLFYDAPGEFNNFSFISVLDTVIIHTISNEVNGVINGGNINCITDGKIHFYGNGEEAPTIYFSIAGDCRQISFIKTGEKYFTVMSEATKKWLEDLKKKTIRHN